MKQKYRQLSQQQLAKVVQSDQKMEFCLSTILRTVKPLTATIAWHYWIE